MLARSKAHAPLCQLGWSAADWAVNNTFKIDAQSAPSNLQPDLMTPTRFQ